MKALTKLITGAAAAAALTVTAAAPAEAQSRRHRDGIDTGDIITGVAVLGGVAAIIAALDNGNNRYGYNNSRYGRAYGYNGYGQPGYGYNGYGYNRYDSAQAAVNACGQEAMRYGQNVQITDLDRTNRGYRVRGVVDQIEYGRGWNRRSNYDREDFTCYAMNGRIYDFRV